jgi:hypothetical protein
MLFTLILIKTMRLDVYLIKSAKILAFLLFLSLLSGCGILSEAEDPLNQNYDAKAKYKDGYDPYANGWDGFDLFGKSDDFKENILWNVALDKVSFMPLQAVDQTSGVITTEWFQSPNDLNNRIKIVIYISSDLVVDESIEVKVFKENFDGIKWNTLNNNNELAEKIEASILENAQELYVANQMS